MSTFHGIPREFPEIRIDQFQDQPGTPFPKACFLSHIHSDHLKGLERSYGGPLIYCSAATKRLLLRLETKSSRMKKMDGLGLEFQRKYRHLGPDRGRDVLRELPYNTPVDIELDPKQKIKVTLFDANHCPGSTMFLIEGNDKAILYTGDIRAEPWWIEQLKRNPILHPYCHGSKRLDNIYLDSTFCSPKAKTIDFGTKAMGIDRLIQKIKQYPTDVRFHFNAWTFGYEELWIALASTFNTKIHVDEYRYQLFKAINHPAIYSNGPCLTGYSICQSTKSSAKKVLEPEGGCLTLDPHATRFHSCERAHVCAGRKGAMVVSIDPTVSDEIAEPATGADGELENSDNVASRKLNNLYDDPTSITDYAKQDIGLEGFRAVKNASGELDSYFRVPYSRHSSFAETRDLVRLFSPVDVYPCVVSPDFIEQNLSIKELFGDICCQQSFFYFDECELPAERMSYFGTNAWPYNAAHDRTEASKLDKPDQSVITPGRKRSCSSIETVPYKESPSTHAVLSVANRCSKRVAVDHIDATKNDEEETAIQFAEDAALGNRGLSWSDVCLLSTREFAVDVYL